MGLIRIVRESGKPNSEILAEMVAEAAPDTLFTYDELRDALEEGTDTRYSNSRVAACVRDANVRLLKRYQRELRNVRGVGFRLVHAREHMALATERRFKADRQLARGLLTMRNVRWNELDDNTRAAHEGQLMLTQAVFQAVRSLEERQNEHAKAIGALSDRLDKAGL